MKSMAKPRTARGAPWYENRYLCFREIRLPTKTMHTVFLYNLRCSQESGLYIRWYLAIIISYSTLQARGELLSY